MRKESRHIAVACTVGAILLCTDSLAALNISTHRIINQRAAELSSLTDVLPQILGMPDGLQAVVRNANGVALSIRSWLEVGGEREDDGGPLTGRFHKHFHNPLKPWSEAGLHALRHNPSSVHWMQEQHERTGENWAWKDARKLYLQALTAPDASTREVAAADLFRALGQIMHLVVDASVPEHARDDAHPFGDISRRLLNSRRAGNYEYWVSDQHEAQGESQFIAKYLSNPIGFDSSLLSIPPPPGETVAAVPIARLIDADRYTADAPDPGVTLSGAIGLAEFANANFFSEDTLFGVFPFPRREGLTPSPRVAPKSSRVRGYFAKPAGQGQPTNVALAECATERSVGRWVVSTSPPYPCVDEAVWEETATHMLPRAVGYARGVLDYFFRGQLVTHTFYGSITKPEESHGWPFPDANVLFVMNSSGEPMDGVFEVYRGGASEHRQRAFVLQEVIPSSLAPGAQFATLMQAPGPGVSRHHVVVFRGRMGLEEDAVVSQMFVVP